MLERKTARVFFSSPFGGLEEEREELTKKYWPQLESMCNRVGYDFIPVDLRWGITSEMSSSAVTIKVCLNEMDRSDMIVGFFGQRYGWHGDNELLQKSFDVAAEYYPWLNDYRDKSVTELEYLHGHLRNPGGRAACFFFRDKAYDDMKLKEAQEKGDEREIRKFVASTDGPHAAERLDDLKQRIADTKDKCLAVHMKYPNPKQGARLMFDTIKNYFNDVLLARPSLKLTARDEENLQHEVFLNSRLGMGGVYVGGDKYFDMTDKFLANPEEYGKTKTLLILGNAGSGKSCFISNWITRQLESPDAIVVYHFIGSTSKGRDPRVILSRLVDELYEELNEKVDQDESLQSTNKDEVHDLVRKLDALMIRVKTAGCKAFIVIDALNKVQESGQIMKPLYWLPKEMPDNVYLVLSTLVSDRESVDELNERGCHTISMHPLDLTEREEMALAALKKRGKTFSTEQRNKIFQKQQTDNPLYLETLLKELVSFGEFFQLDSYIENLLQANDTVVLFLKFLERLEKDYNPAEFDGNMTEEIMCCIHVSRQGLSESEIKVTLNISNQAWSAVFFAMDDFLTESNCLYSFGYDELASAVSKRYFDDSENKSKYIRKVADYFETKLEERSVLYNTTIPERVYMELPFLLKKLNDKERLIECLLKPPMFYSLRSGENMYDLISYWNSTGLSGEELVNKHNKVIDDQLALFYNEGIEKGMQGSNYALGMVIPYVYELAQFLGNAGHTAASRPITERVLQMVRTLHTSDEIKHNPEVAIDYVNIANTLACQYVDIEEFDKGEQLHKEVLEIKQNFETVFDDGKRELAKTLNGLGVLMFKISKNQEALDYYQQSIEKHREANSPPQEIADILNNQGAVYHKLGQWEDAIKVMKNSLEIYEEAYFGKLPADVGGTILNLAMAYRRLDKDEEAEALYLRALKIRENAYGVNHHEVGQTLLSYAAFLTHANPEKAVEVSKRGADIYEKSFGLDHINTLNALENVALAYLFLQKPQEAHPYFKRAGERKEATNRMNTSIQRMNAVMADYYLNSGQNDEARSLFGRIVKADFATDRDFAALDYLDSELPSNKRPIRPREHTVYHGIEKFPNSVMILGRLQVHYSEKGKADEMIDVLVKGDFGVEHYNNAYKAFVDCKHKKEGIKLLEKAHMKFPKDTIILCNLASAYFVYKDYLKSAKYFKSLFDLDPGDINCLESYAKAVSLAGRPHEARDLFDKAVKLAENSADKELIKRLNASMKLLDDMQIP